MAAEQSQRELVVVLLLLLLLLLAAASASAEGCAERGIFSFFLGFVLELSV